jgi:beta-xylosidase
MGANYIHNPISEGDHPDNTSWRYKEYLELEGTFTAIDNMKMYHSEDGSSVSAIQTSLSWNKL